MTHNNTQVIAHPIDYVDPLALFAGLRGEGLAVLLDSAAPAGGSGRYTLVATDPVLKLAVDWPTAFEQLEAIWQNLPQFRSAPGWPVGPGLIGSFGYELRRALERVPGRQPRNSGLPDLILGLFDTVVAFDVVERRAAILACDIDRNRLPAAHRIAALIARIVTTPALPDLDWTLTASWIADLSPDGHAGMVARIVDYIYAGDIYQANFTQRWIAARPPSLDAFDLYRRLRTLSPAPYASFLQDGAGNSLVSASPELFLQLSSQGNIETRPIKGTRPRGATEHEDLARAKELLDSGKDQSENLMIVDLLRNDLGRVAEFGSVVVPELNALRSFSSVHHLVSTVRARLRRGLGPLDLLKASFPGGSVTGVPKIRAMEIIDALEAARRGHYCGSIGWIGLDGGMELSITIRTLTVTPDSLIAQAGGGIVADSDPMSEYEEALTKARPLLATVDPAYREAPRSFDR